MDRRILASEGDVMNAYLPQDFLIRHDPERLYARSVLLLLIARKAVERAKRAALNRSAK